MKAVIKGKSYNTATARRVAAASVYGVPEVLYLTRRGDCFIARHTAVADCVLLPLTAGEADFWLVQHAPPLEIFWSQKGGPIVLEDACAEPSDGTIYARVPENVKRQIVEYAAKSGVTVKSLARASD